MSVDKPPEPWSPPSFERPNRAVELKGPPPTPDAPPQREGSAVSLTADGVAQGLAVDRFEALVDRVQGEWSVVWFEAGTEAGRATFKEGDDGRLEWTRFNVRDDYRGNGLFTAALRFSHDAAEGASIAADTDAADFYLSAGFKEGDPGWIVSDEKAARRWLKGR